MSITDDEMEPFEIQAECRYLYKPQIFGSDHGKMWKKNMTKPLWLYN